MAEAARCIDLLFTVGVPNDTSANVRMRQMFDRMAKQLDIDFVAIGEQVLELGLRVG
jgi:hypothetical protein